MKKMMKLLQPVPLGRLLPLLLALVLLCGACVTPPAATEAPTAAPADRRARGHAGPAATEAPAATKVPAATEAARSHGGPGGRAPEHPVLPRWPTSGRTRMRSRRSSTTLIADAQAGGRRHDALLDRIDEALADFNAASSALSLCYVYYAHDVSDAYYRDEYAELLAALNRIDLLMTTRRSRCSSAGTGWRLRAGARTLPPPSRRATSSTTRRSSRCSSRSRRWCRNTTI